MPVDPQHAEPRQCPSRGRRPPGGGGGGESWGVRRRWRCGWRAARARRGGAARRAPSAPVPQASIARADDVPGDELRARRAKIEERCRSMRIPRVEFRRCGHRRRPQGLRVAREVEEVYATTVKAKMRRCRPHPLWLVSPGPPVPLHLPRMLRPEATRPLLQGTLEGEAASGRGGRVERKRRGAKPVWRSREQRGRGRRSPIFTESPDGGASQRALARCKICLVEFPRAQSTTGQSWRRRGEDPTCARHTRRRNASSAAAVAVRSHPPAL